MTEAEKKYVEKDLSTLFPDSGLIYNDTRFYSMFTVTPNTNFTIGFDTTDSNTVEYMLIKKG